MTKKTLIKASPKTALANGELIDLLRFNIGDFDDFLGRRVEKRDITQTTNPDIIPVHAFNIKTDPALKQEEKNSIN